MIWIVCRIEDCERPSKYAGLCKPHLKQRDYQKHKSKRKAVPRSVQLANQRTFIQKHREHVNAYNRFSKLIRKMLTPKWANKEAIKKIYMECPKGMQVDHIVPLRGKTVCGFNVEYNLQYLTASENAAKGNKFGN